MYSLSGAVGLVLLGLVLLISEAFIPSAGLLGLLSVLSFIAGVGLAFHVGGMSTGTLFLVGTLTGIGSAVAALIRIWPRTEFGRSFLVLPPPADSLVPDRSALSVLVGRRGVARSLLLPSGSVEIDGKSYEAISIGGPIEKGTAIEVVQIRERNLLVQLASLPMGKNMTSPRESLDQETQVLRPLDASTSENVKNRDSVAPSGTSDLIPDPFDT